MALLRKLALVALVAASSGASLRGGRRLNELEVVPADEAEALKAQEDAQREAAKKEAADALAKAEQMMAAAKDCLLYTSPSPRDKRQSRMPSSA